MRDIDMRQNIIHELEFELGADAANIGVSVDEGVVRLTGHLGSHAEKSIAELVVLRVDGIRAIAQGIEIRLPDGKKTADDEIAHRALKILAWDAAIPEGRVLIKVQEGWITLSGAVEWHYQKTGAENAVRKLSGVAGVINRITVRPGSEAGTITRRIADALKRELEGDLPAAIPATE